MRARILLRCCFVLMMALAIGICRAEPLTLLVIGDTGDCETDGTARVSAALQRQPDWQKARLVEVGDLAYPTATLERLLECHEPYFGKFERRLAVPGNHDWYDPGARGFFGLFPDPVPRTEKLNDRWTMLLLDSNLRGDAWQQQLAWLDGAMKSAAGQCVIAAWHHPRWSSGHRGGAGFVDPVWQRIAGQAALTLHGHDHHYETLPALDARGEAAASGTRSFIVGNGGAELYRSATDRPGTDRPGSVAVFGRWGFLRLDIDGDDYRWLAQDVDGAVLDAGAGRCRPVAAGGR